MAWVTCLLGILAQQVWHVSAAYGRFVRAGIPCHTNQRFVSFAMPSLAIPSGWQGKACAKQVNPFGLQIEDMQNLQSKYGMGYLQTLPLAWGANLCLCLHALLAMVSEAYLQTLPLAWEAYQRFVSVARRSKQATIATPYKSVLYPVGVKHRFVWHGKAWQKWYLLRKRFVTP